MRAVSRYGNQGGEITDILFKQAHFCLRFLSSGEEKEGFAAAVSGDYAGGAVSSGLSPRIG